jgi:hypothetical protein
LLQKYRCKKRSQENTIVSLIKGVNVTKQGNTDTDKLNVMFAAVDLLGKMSMSMSTIDKTGLITKSIFDTRMPILRKV